MTSRSLAVAMLALFVSAMQAAEPTWNPADAVREAENDIRNAQIKFYWAGSIAVGPVGVPIELAKKYPRADAGIGCTTTDVLFRKQQEEYARRYNARILQYLRAP